MIVDCYTHTWISDAQLGRAAPIDGTCLSGTPATQDMLDAGHERHRQAADTVDTTIVLGFKSRYLQADIPNDEIAAYVAQSPDKLIGFAGIDPSNPKEAIAEMHRAKNELDMPGIAIAPAAQDFHPTNSLAMLVYEEAAKLRMPVVFHTGIHITAATRLEYAQPVLLDEVAREWPDLNIIIAHMGYPWVNETIVLLAKHTNVYAEISWLLRQPWQAYQTLLSAHQFGVIDKLLLGSGFPATTASECIEALYGINHLYQGTSLPTVPREALRGIVERDTLTLLGIDRATRTGGQTQGPSATVSPEPNDRRNGNS